MTRGIHQWYKRGDRVLVVNVSNEDYCAYRKKDYIGRTGILNIQPQSSNGSYTSASIAFDDGGDFFFSRVKIRKI